MGLLIDQLAYSNKLLQVHPGEKLAFAILTLLLVLYFSHPVLSLLVCCLMSIGVVFQAGINGKVYGQLLMWPLAFLLPGVMAIALVVEKGSGELLVFLPFFSYRLGISMESLVQAAVVFSRALAAICCMYFLILTTPVTDQLVLLRRMKVPGMIIELVALIYRFITILLALALTIYLSQQARLGYRNLKCSFFSLAGLLGAVFTQGFFRLQKMSLALEARCYQGETIFLERDYCLSRRNIIGIVFLELTLVLLGLYLGGLYGIHH